MRRPERNGYGDEEPRHGPDTLRVWRGTVVGRTGDDVFVELGPRMQGVISARSFDEEPELGRDYDFTLRGREDGLWALSLSHARHLSSWEEAEVGSVVHARVVRQRPGGLELKIGPLHAFLPKSHSGLAREENPEVLVGRNVTCEVIEVDPERQRVIVSRRLVLRRGRVSEHHREVDRLEPGQRVQGRVTRVEPYGVFLRFGRGIEGLIHVSDLAHERVENPADVVHVGQNLEARVLYIKKGGKRIGLGVKQLDESPWLRAERVLWEGQVVEGEVTRLAPFGVFVQLELGVEGLVHLSETGLPQGESLHAVAKKGDRVSVRVVELDAEAERLALSLLHANGSRIQTDEAANALSFQELVDASREGRLSTSLGNALRDALDTPPDDGPREPSSETPH